MQDTIVLKNLTMRFDGITAVDGIDLNVKSGEVLGVLGSNGAGKSTTMKALAGILKPSSGSLLLDGLNVANRKEAERAKEITGYCPDVGGLLVGATPREHIQLLLNMHENRKPYDLALALLDRIGLGKYVDTPVGGFSHGESRRLSVMLAALSAEKILVLDEPFDGVDPVGVAEINYIVDEAKRSGLAVVISTHLQPLLAAVSDDIVIMSKGRILTREPSRRFQGKRGVRRYERLLASV